MCSDEFRHVLCCPPARDGQGQMRCGGPPREQASARLSSSMGALMNAASSVLPMVRSPLAASKPLLSAYRVFCFLAHGGHGGHFPFPTRNNKALSCVRVCVCCLCIAGAGVKVSPAFSLPIDARRCAQQGCCSPVPSPGPWGAAPVCLVYVPCLGVSGQPRTAGKTMIGPSRFLGAAPGLAGGLSLDVGRRWARVRRDLEPLATKAQPYLDLCDGGAHSV